MSRTLGNNLRRFLMEEDITAVMLAEWSGVKQAAIYNWMSGKHGATAVNLYKVAKVLGKTMEEFMEEPK